MHTSSAYPVIGFARRCNRHQRRCVRRIRLTSFPKLSNPYSYPRFSGAARIEDFASGKKTVLQVGSYLLGEENCPLLYGPDDVRY